MALQRVPASMSGWATGDGGMRGCDFIGIHWSQSLLVLLLEFHGIPVLNKTAKNGENIGEDREESLCAGGVSQAAKGGTRTSNSSSATAEAPVAQSLLATCRTTCPALVTTWRICHGF